MSARHTPGPWAAVPWRRASPTTVVKQINGEHLMTIADVEGDGFDPETRANARLMAAAPDLLALAKQYASECGECNGTGQVYGTDYNYHGALGVEVVPFGEPCPDCADIRAVIAKAE